MCLRLFILLILEINQHFITDYFIIPVVAVSEALCVCTTCMKHANLLYLKTFIGLCIQLYNQ